MAARHPLPARRERTLAEQLGRAADVALKLELIAIDERRPAAITEQLLDQTVALGEALIRLGRGQQHARIG